MKCFPLKVVHVYPFLYHIHVLVYHVGLMSANKFEYQLQQKMPSISSNTPTVDPHNGLTPPSTMQGGRELHRLYFTSTSVKYSPASGVPNLPLVPCVTIFKSIGVISGKHNFVKYNNFPQTLTKPCCLSWQKLVCSYKNILFNTIYKKFI